MSKQPALNPYDPPKLSDDSRHSKLRWTRNFLLLNLILFLLPMMFVVLGYIALRLAMESVNGGVYDTQLTGFSVISYLPILLYVLIPNLSLLCWMTVSGSSRHPPNQQNELD